MPKATDSNTINIPQSHPAILLEQHIKNLQHTLQACRDITNTFSETGGEFKTGSDTAGLLLNRIIRQFDQHNTQIEQLTKQLAASSPDRPQLKTLRNQFIAELAEKGFSNREIAQGLNLHLSFVNKLIAKLAAKSKAAQAHNTPEPPS